MNFSMFLWLALVLIVAGIVALNVWDPRHRKPMSIEQRELDEENTASDLRQC
jgi:hypothetical protein